MLLQLELHTPETLLQFLELLTLLLQLLDNLILLPQLEHTPLPPQLELPTPPPLQSEHTPLPPQLPLHMSLDPQLSPPVLEMDIPELFNQELTTPQPIK